MTRPCKDSKNEIFEGPSLQWHVLGGNNKNRIGANAGLCVYEDLDDDGNPQRTTLLFDIGVLAGDKRCPEDPALAECDIVIPDLDRFLYKKDDPAHVPEMPIDSIFLTHNHTDHMGAIPLLILMGYKLPKIYATPYTAKRLEQELSNAGLSPDEWPQILDIAPGKAIEEGPVSVTAFSVSHSTPQSVGFFIETPEGNILNPGDFKLDKTLVWGPGFSEEQFRRIVSKPVDLMLLDSTGADRDVTPVTEHDMRETMRDLMEEYPNKRFIVAVMAGYEENLGSVATVAAENDRVLWIAGSAHEQVLAAMEATGMSFKERTGLDIDVRVLSGAKATRELAELKPKESLVVVTGASGQNSAVLSRAVEGQHPALKLNPKTDIVVFCAPSIPGQEGMRERLLASLRNKGFTVLTKQDAALYPQAHARLPEIIEIVKLANPKHIVPIHGTNDLRACNAEAMKKMGKSVTTSNNGDVLRVSRNGVQSTDAPTKNHPPMIGIKTLQGATWDDRYYLVTRTPKEKSPDKPKPANNNKKLRPKIFNLDKK